MLTWLSVFFMLMSPVLSPSPGDWMTKNGNVRLYSHTPLEDIKAENRQVLFLLDPEKQTVKAMMLVKAFLFEKALMQEHFNENYIESDKYPKAGFEGTFEPAIDLSRKGKLDLTVKGNITLHGVTKQISFPAVVEVKEQTIAGQTRFLLKPEDFQIKIPGLVRDKIASEMEVTVSFECKP
ncbi:YceI family protein [Flavihumibacter petaseus]|uniref:Lipid/polyisoprenoid-binding YceI-like domain-containing protein n=1 Tax=Flavihumibacter petaseus NBRC 106054 TaxID=1220578 RepID=A0A0E9N3H8_9BACT|nr:YceI family protein [Flavihumibacter petaseus]GAO43900.1 hypothetical protein FPE01S_02_10060 [Flavihumibacter petaseus NBRC 106054]